MQINAQFRHFLRFTNYLLLVSVCLLGTSISSAGVGFTYTANGQLNDITLAPVDVRFEEQEGDEGTGLLIRGKLIKLTEFIPGSGQPQRIEKILVFEMFFRFVETSESKYDGINKTTLISSPGAGNSSLKDIAEFVGVGRLPNEYLNYNGKEFEIFHRGEFGEDEFLKTTFTVSGVLSDLNILIESNSAGIYSATFR